MDNCIKAPEPVIQVERLSLTYQSDEGEIEAIRELSFSVYEGEIVSVIGPSGCGKSTLLSIASGLLAPTSGRVVISGGGNIGYMLQKDSLFPWRTIRQNVLLGVEIRSQDKKDASAYVDELLHTYGLWEFKDVFPNQLSGGMRQRVGIARALANDPEVLLMDEPFSALDPLVRRDMQFELLSLQRKLKKTVVFVTHDIDEAFKLGDTVAIMRDGKIVQVGTPEQMSSNPVDDYVRDFIGAADKTKVLTVKNIMMTPTCLMRRTDGAEHAIREMRKNALSTVYVVDDDLRLEGVLTISEAIRALREGLSVGEVMAYNVEKTTESALVADILPVAAETLYPIAVTDGENHLRGIVTKAGVLSSLV